ncbi:RING-H2 finger protein ATL5-like [Mercurialis annua]|uniref:RING-H2 finger protein ATL5-like n=1 Tax=Mercurialis annua TaxID=3986 RepID=UPI00215F2F8C|nr:RING-H2 finger protein ATL5-like [Mercurialis annua]
MLNLPTSITTPFKWALNFIQNYYQQPQIPENNGNHEELKIYKYKTSGAEEFECAICLSKIEEDSEIRESRCVHIFHRVCLDRWVYGYGRSSCPLCRNSVGPRRFISDLRLEVLVFKFSSFTSSDDRDTWWLR